MNVIRVCYIRLICYTFYNTKPFLETLCKLIRCAFKWCTIQREVDILFFLPFCTSVIHMFHNFKCKRRCRRVSMRFSCHISCAFAKSCIAKRNSRITAIQQFIYCFTLLKPCQSTVLPKDRGNIRRCALESLMSAHQSPMTKFQTFVKDLPELIYILMRRTSYIYKIYGYNALIKSSVIFRLAIFIKIWSQEASATHTIVRNHSLSCTTSSKLCKIEIRCVLCYILFFKNVYKFWKRRCYPSSLFVFYALYSLSEYFFDYKSEICFFSFVLSFAKIHKHSNKRSLSIGGH